MKAVGGRIVILRNGIRQRVKGTFSYNLGAPVRKVVMGHDGPEGYSETPGEPYFEGEFTDTKEFDLQKDLFSIKDETIVMELASGKAVVWEEATYTGTGVVQTEEGNVNARFSAKRARELR